MLSTWRWVRFTLLLLVLAAALPADATTGRTVLPALAKGEFYVLVGDGYASRRSIHDDALSLLDLRAGRELWRRDPDIGHLQSSAVVDGILILTGLAYADATRTALQGGTDQTIAVELRSGRELWRHKGAFLYNHVGAIVPIWCNGCSGDAVGVEARTGREVWRSPWLKSSNYFDGRAQWSVAHDGTVRAVDLTTGAARVVGTLPPGYWIIDGSARYIMAVPPAGSDPFAYPGVGLFDHGDLHRIEFLDIPNTLSFPPDLWLCGDLMCQRGGVEMKALGLHGDLRYTKNQFLLHTVVERDGRTLILGEQSRSGRVTPGVPMDTNQILDAATGEVLADIGVWQFVRIDADRIWVALYASRDPAELITSPWSQPQHETVLGYIDLRPGAPLAVTTVRGLGDPYEHCDFAYGWLLCTNDFTHARSVALHVGDPT